jgi:hypothetical protein
MVMGPSCAPDSTTCCPPTVSARRVPGPEMAVTVGGAYDRRVVAVITVPVVWPPITTSK